VRCTGRGTREGRQVAIKVATERFSDRFEREAQAIAALSQPEAMPLIRRAAQKALDIDSSLPHAQAWGSGPQASSFLPETLTSLGPLCNGRFGAANCDNRLRLRRWTKPLARRTLGVGLLGVGLPRSAGFVYSREPPSRQ
jgi:hypothetical protein